MSTAPPKTRELPEFVDDLVRLGTAEIVGALGTPEDQAKAVMARVAAAVVSEYARFTLYVPVGFSTRNVEIYRKYGECSASAAPYSQDRIAELAAEYQLTTRQLYNIVAAIRAEQTAASQPKLPGFED
jgi:Mor family transcriptional regulator